MSLIVSSDDAGVLSLNWEGKEVANKGVLDIVDKSSSLSSLNYGVLVISKYESGTSENLSKVIFPSFSCFSVLVHVIR